jgi:hypothetical protein
VAPRAVGRVGHHVAAGGRRLDPPLRQHAIEPGPEVVCSAFVDEPVETEALAAADRLKVIFVYRTR